MRIGAVIRIHGRIVPAGTTARSGQQLPLIIKRERTVFEERLQPG
jgi:hypothetical protein